MVSLARMAREAGAEGDLRYALLPGIGLGMANARVVSDTTERRERSFMMNQNKREKEVEVAKWRKSGATAC